MDEHTCLSELSEVAAVLFLCHNFFDFHGHSRGEAWEHCSSTSQHNVLNEGDEVVDVASAQTLVDFFMEATVLDSCQHRVKHALGGLEALASDLDHTALLVGQHVLLVEKSGLIRQFTILLRVVRNEAFGLFNLSNSLEIG